MSTTMTVKSCARVNRLGLPALIMCAVCIAGTGAWAAQEQEEYRIDQPGTITFTVGVKIKGKVEKPQVMIFLPKEKPVYRKITFERSFIDDIKKPLPYEPIVE